MLNFADRVLTIAVTATLTSAGWIIVGSGYLTRDAPDAVGAPANPSASSAPVSAGSSVQRSAIVAGPLIIPVTGLTPAN